MQKCSHCAEEIQDDALICPSCGKEVPKLQPGTDPNSPTPGVVQKSLPRQSVTRILAMIAGIVIIAGVAYTVMTLPQNYVHAQETRAVITQAAQTQVAQTATADFITNGPCAVPKVEVAIPKLQESIKAFSETHATASSTPRDALDVSMQLMRDIKKTTEAIEVPECLVTAKQNLLDGYTNTIEAFTLFIDQKPVSEIKAYVKKAEENFKGYADEIARISQCAPGCN